MKTFKLPIVLTEAELHQNDAVREATTRMAHSLGEAIFNDYDLFHAEVIAAPGGLAVVTLTVTVLENQDDPVPG